MRCTDLNSTGRELDLRLFMLLAVGLFFVAILSLALIMSWRDPVSGGGDKPVGQEICEGDCATCRSLYYNSD